MSEGPDVKAVSLRDQDLKGKVALVTGASRGIGRCVALNLASRGCHILGTCSKPESVHLIDVLATTIRDLYKGTNIEAQQQQPRVVGIDANILDPSIPRKLADALQQHFGGRVDIFVNNAAVVTAEKIGALSAESIASSLTGNIEVPVRIVEELVQRRMFRPHSRIVYVSSVRARKAWADQSMYMATKSGGEALCRCWADAFGGKYAQYDFMAGTTANAVSVGITRTDSVYNDWLPYEVVKTFEEEMVPSQSIPRVGLPEDVADVIGLLCRDEARWITGSVVCGDGGGIKIL